MNLDEYTVLGVMSGTSLDGIDLALVKFTYKGEWSFKLLAAKTIPYDKGWVNKLKNAVLLSPAELSHLDKKYTIYLAEVINIFLANCEKRSIDFISSHGHTIFHEPARGITYQIGNLSEL